MKFNLKRSSISFCIVVFFTALNSYAQSPKEYIKDQVIYSSSMDAENIYVELSTDDKSTMLSMLHRGFYVYFDVKGKKKKNVSVQYPSEIVPAPRQAGRNNGSNGNLETQAQKGPNMLVMLDELPRMARYTNFDFVEEFHLDLNNLGIVIAYSAEDDQLHYKLKMPKTMISDKTIDLSKLSIGVVSAQKERDSKEKRPSISMGGGGQSGGSGGGGGRPKGKGKGGSRPDQSSEEDEGTREVTLDFWFTPY